MTKRKIPERAADCLSLQDKIGFSLRMHDRLEALQGDPWAGPEQFSALMDEYEFDLDKYPWAHPTWASNYARAQEEKAPVLRSIARAERREANRKLYGKSKRP
jgi:hypothetical protein